MVSKKRVYDHGEPRAWMLHSFQRYESLVYMYIVAALLQKLNGLLHYAVSIYEIPFDAMP